jgi:hypothetical protein
MPYQRASLPHPVHTSHELISVQLPGQALEQDQDSSLESPAVPQATESNRSCNAHHAAMLLDSIELPELALKEEAFNFESIVVSQTPQSTRSSSSSYEIPLLSCNLPPRQALDEEQEGVHVSLRRPTRSSDNGQQIPALEITRGELFSFVPEECVRSSNIERQRSRTTQYCRSARGHEKTSCFLLLIILSILGVAQALTDCKIIHDWIPSRFNETSCCEQSGITCVAGRITKMYVAIL